MADFDITEYITGVTMDGTEFNFDALCLSVTKMVIIQMIVNWVQARVENEYPSDFANNPALFRWVFHSSREEIVDSIWKRYDEIYASVRDQLQVALGVQNSTQ